MKKLEKNECRECLPLFIAAYFVFQFATENIKIKINRTIIVYVLNGCKTWSVIMREEQ
jgi:hypothetical protein